TVSIVPIRKGNLSPFDLPIKISDVNSAYNIIKIKKIFPEAYAEGIEGVGLHSVRVRIA
ncbi:hypothetical protein SAMN04244560_02927, partial [Thermoanaerobacter thermohydrosulfuricus]